MSTRFLKARFLVVFTLLFISVVGCSGRGSTLSTVSLGDATSASQGALLASVNVKYPSSREITRHNGQIVRPYHFGTSARFRKTKNGFLVVHDYDSLFIFRLEDARLFTGKTDSDQNEVDPKLIGRLSSMDSKRLVGLEDLDIARKPKLRSGECEDCVSPPIVGGEIGSGESASSSGRRAQIITGPCDPAITQSDCVPHDPFGFTITINIGSGGDAFAQTCFYDGANFDYSADACYANRLGTIFNIHGPLSGTATDYYRDIPRGTTHFINNIAVNSDPYTAQDLFYTYEDVEGGSIAGIADHDLSGLFYPSAYRRINIQISLTKTRFSHAFVNWTVRGSFNPPIPTGSGEAYLARNNYVN